MRSRLAGHPMRYLCCTIAALLLAALWSRAEAAVVVQIDRASQRMAVSVDGAPRYHWRVSTARLYHAARHLSSGNAGAALVLAQILQFADATFDLLLRRLCYPRQLRNLPSRPPGLARLRAA